MKKRCPSCGSQVSIGLLPSREIVCGSCSKSLVLENKALELAAIVVAAVFTWLLPTERLAWWVVAVSYLAIGAAVGWIGLRLIPLAICSKETNQSGSTADR